MNYILNRKYCKLLVPVLFLFSCSKQIEIELPTKDSLIVINSLISPLELPYASNLKVDLYLSSSLLDTNEYEPISDAVVKLLADDTVVTELFWNDSLNYYSPNESPWEYNLKEGYSYTLQVTHKNLQYNIVEKIPLRATDLECTINPYAGTNEDGSIISRLTLSFKDNLNVANYYEIELRDLVGEEESNYFITSDDPSITSEPYYTSNLTLDTPPPKNLPFNDKSFNGENKQISIYYTPPTNNEKTQVRSHKVHVIFRTISESYYKYRVSLMQQVNNRKGSILYGMVEPNNVYSNIEGGLGIVGASSNNIVTLVVEEN